MVFAPSRLAPSLKSRLQLIMARDSQDLPSWTEVVGPLTSVEIRNGRKLLTIGDDRIVVDSSRSYEEFEQLIGKRVSVLWTGQSHLIRVEGENS